MAHFRGELKGARGKVSRLGTKRSGLTLLAQTWGHDLRVELHHDDDHDGATGHDFAFLVVRDHETGALVKSFVFNLTTGKVAK